MDESERKRRKKEYDQRYLARHPDKRKETQKKWNAAHKKEKAAYMREWRRRQREKQDGQSEGEQKEGE